MRELENNNKLAPKAFYFVNYFVNYLANNIYMRTYVWYHILEVIRWT